MEKREFEKINIDNTEYLTRLNRKFAGRQSYKPADQGLIFSFIPGTVVEILVKEGDSVSEGDEVIILEAMKMKNRLKSHTGGTVKSVKVKTGDRVTKGAVLMEIR